MEKLIYDLIATPISWTNIILIILFVYVYLDERNFGLL